MERILGIDPSLRGTGYAVLEGNVRSSRCLHYGVVKNPPKLPVSQCLREIYQTLEALITKYQPTAMAIEATIFVQSYQTAIVLGAARGAALLAAAQHTLPIYEYAPRKIKLAVVGRGGAQKDQVAFMVRALTGLTETPPPDAADAIAIAITHYQAHASAVARRENLPTV